MKEKGSNKKEKRTMKKRILAAVAAGVLILGMAGCAGNASGDEKQETKKEDAAEEEKSAGEKSPEEKPAKEESAEQFDKTTVTIFAAKSLNGVVDELIGMYQETQPNVEIIAIYDSSGTLMEQIEQGAACDLFFSAAQKQMDQLESDELLVSGTRKNVVNNQVCVVTCLGSETSVTGLANLAEAESFALADGSVPVGKYTRQAIVNAGMLDETEDVSKITTEEVSAALNGIEINECANVGAVTAAVAEGSNEVGTVYKSDTYGLEDRLELLEVVSNDLTGDVIYPVAQTVNEEADDLEMAAASDFLRFLTSEQAKEIYEKYYFDTDV